MKKIQLYFLFFGVLTSFAQAAKITASVNPLSIGLTDTLTLTLSADHKPDDDPDLSVLATDFEVLNTSKSANYSIINGATSQNIQWQIQLLAKKTGELTIPAISFGKDKSNAVKIKVMAQNQLPPSQQQNDILLLIEATKKAVYQQQAVIVKVRFLRQIELLNPSLTTLTTNDIDAEIIQLAQSQSKVVTYKGERYYEMQVSYAVIPSKKGTLTINPMRLEAHEASSQMRPSFGFGFSRQGKLRRVISKALQIQVKAKPANAPEPWLPAKNISLSESWSKTTWKVGESITRTILFIADGLNQHQLPEIKMPSNQSFKLYPDKPQIETKKHLNGISSILKQQFAIIPLKEGEITIPKMQIKWWNTETDQLETAILKERTITVLANPEVMLPPPQTTQKMPSQNKIVQPVMNPASPAVKTVTDSYLWLAVFFGMAWIVTLIAWGLSRKKLPIKKVKKVIKKPNLTHLKKACLNNQADEIKSALLAWAKVHWAKEQPKSLTAIGFLSQDDKLKAEINLLEQALYKGEIEYRNGAILFDLIQNLPPNHQMTEEKPFIPPLYSMAS